jgi:hypothetical protein
MDYKIELNEYSGMLVGNRWYEIDIFYLSGGCFVVAINFLGFYSKGTKLSQHGKKEVVKKACGSVNDVKDFVLAHFEMEQSTHGGDVEFTGAMIDNEVLTKSKILGFSRREIVIPSASCC